MISDIWIKVLTHKIFYEPIEYIACCFVALDYHTQRRKIIHYRNFDDFKQLNDIGDVLNAFAAQCFSSRRGVQNIQIYKSAKSVIT